MNEATVTSLNVESFKHVGSGSRSLSENFPQNTQSTKSLIFRLSWSIKLWIYKHEHKRNWKKVFQTDVLFLSDQPYRLFESFKLKLWSCFKNKFHLITECNFHPLHATQVAWVHLLNFTSFIVFKYNTIFMKFQFTTVL